MSPKEYLRDLRYMDARVNSKLDQAAQLRALAEKMTSVLNPNRGSGRTSRDSSAVIDKLIDLEREINRMVDDLVDRKRDAERQIKQIPNSDERTVLDLRYLRRYSWDQIAEEMHCDRVTAWRYHGHALLRISVPENLQQNETS